MKETVTLEQVQNCGIEKDRLLSLFPVTPGDWFIHPDTGYPEVAPTPDPSGYEHNWNYILESTPLPSLKNLLEFVTRKEPGTYKIIFTEDRKWYIYSHTYAYNVDPTTPLKYDDLIDALWNAFLFIEKQSND